MTRPSEEQIQREEAGRRAYYEKRELLEMTCSVYAVLDDMGNIICTFEDRGHAEHFFKETPFAASIHEPHMYRYVRPWVAKQQEE